MSIDDRADKLRKVVDGKFPAGVVDDLSRAMITAQIADCESKVAAALVHFLQGNAGPAMDLIGHAHNAAGAIAGVPIGAAFGAAAEALTAAVGDDRTRGQLAVMALQERAAEFAAVNEDLITRHAGTNPQ